MKSIKRRLVGSFMFVILISVVILEMLLINAVKQYYYNNIEEMLINQIKISSDFYRKYFSKSSLEQNLLDNVDAILQQTTAQVQIVDLSGNILMDSIGVPSDEKVKTEDFKKAVNGKTGKWIGYASYDKANVMTISQPIETDTNKIIGVLRFTSSLSNIDGVIRRIAFVFIGIGVIVIFISGTVSLLLANSIIGPLKEVTNIAEKMAAGNLKIRSKKKYNDEMGKLSDTLNYMADEILKKDQLKNEFISSISHELRTPLTSIKGWAITLNSEDLEDKEVIRDGLTIIEKESDRLTGMVEELLDLSKFVSGKISLKMENVDIVEIIKHIEIQVTPRANRENIKFIVKYEENLPIVHIDKNRIIQVLINVLDNAFKFINENGMVIFKTEKYESNIILSVEDNGCGISSDELPKVRQKFYKGKSSKSQNGIGLSICDEIIKLHNGTLIIESELNKGTKVTIILPL